MSHIHSEVYGSGRPLVMIHGWAMHAGIWRDFALQLVRHCQVICIDLPGHGRSEAIAPYTLDTVAETLLAAIPVERFSLLGWSLGATVAMAMAERFPDSVDKLLVLAGNPRFVQDGDWPGVGAGVLDDFATLLKSDVAQTLVRFLALQVNGLAYGKPLLKRLKQSMSECPPPAAEVLRAGLDILKIGDMRPFMRSSQIPVSMIMGGKDALVPVACAQRVRQMNSRVGVHIVDSAGHVPFLSHPEQMIALIADSL
ncbi:MAG: pimeloyl-ACP methyl ester esterase BioH [Methylomonas sp.]|nr:pimeloyl-ACP methyl ester esterase BioH [Methylomonas sp.]